MKTIILDTECYSNYWLCSVTNEQGQIKHFELFRGHTFDRIELKKLLSSRQVVTFNGTNYDMPLIQAALKGASNAALKAISDDIIINSKPGWKVYKERDIVQPSYRHVDLIEVAPGFGSLKAYGGRMNAPRLQDLPIAPDAKISAEDREALRRYCVNDLETTRLLFDTLRPQIELRERMSSQYDLDLLSKSDAQIAEAVIRRELEKKTGKFYKKPHIKAGTAYRYKAPAWLQFKTSQLSDLLGLVESLDFKVSSNGSINLPDELSDKKITIGASVYRLGIGGLHSSEKAQIVKADDNHLLFDMDVASYYPSIILEGGYYPKQLGREFLEVYRSIVEQRLSAKRKTAKLNERIKQLEKKIWEIELTTNGES